MFIIANAIILVGQPFAMAKIMDILEKQGVTAENFNVVVAFLILTLVCELGFWTLHGPARCMERSNAFRVRTAYRRFLLKGILTLPMEWHVDHHSGDTIDRIEKGTSALFSFAEESFEVIESMAVFTVSYIVLVYFGSLSVACITLGMLLGSGWITIRFDKMMMIQYQELNRSENQISESIFDAVSNISTVIILRVEKLVFNTIMQRVEKPYDLFRDNQRLNELKWFLTNVCCAVMTVVVLAVYFREHIGTAPGVLVASSFLLISYLNKISELFFRFTSMYGDIIKRKSRVMNAEELTADFKIENFTNHVLPKNWKQLEISNLNFSYYTKGNDLHLDNVSLSLTRGQRIAIIGRSGDGKSTLLKVMRNLYSPQTVILKADGYEISDGFGGISRDITLVPQDPEIFATTIIRNITMGAEYELDFVRHFTDMACFTEVVDALPKKFDSSIKEKGVNLSGGEQQRLALSRGLLACHDKSIVLLDEPTSSLDMATEMKVYRNIFREFQGKTFISSVHRLHLLPMFDKIYMFSEGKIIASGNLGELVANCPEFQELWRQYHEHQVRTDGQQGGQQ